MTRAVAEATTLALLSEATATLEAARVAGARGSAEWLLAAVLGVDRFAVYLEPGRELCADEAARYRALVGRRATGEPLQHLLGFEDFHGLRLAVTPDVLIPRPETEGLVEWAIEVLRERPAAAVADVGTGSGAIACALAARLPGLRVLATDCSPAALAVASRNVRSHGLSDRVRLVAGDLVEPLSGGRVRLDLVVANPPYLPSAVIRSLPAEVSAWEPRLALDGGPDGMAVLRRVIASVPAVLAPGGSLLMEIGEEQAGPLACLLAARGFSGIRSRRDLNGVERCIGGRWTAAPASRREAAC
jgi:release factor glutamine methyltransferase